MALSMKDMVRGTIVDWTYRYDAEERIEELRPVRRRGIIVRTVGVQDAVTEVWVQFKNDSKPEKVPARELIRVFPFNHRVSRRALARISGTSESVGGEFEERRAPVRPRVEDSLALTPRRPAAVVEPEHDEVDPMIASQEEPIVIPVEDDDVK